MIALGDSASSTIQISPTSKISIDDWFQADIEIKVNCFSGKINAFFESGDLTRFYHDVIKLNKTLKGKAELLPREDQFKLSLIADNLGHIIVKGHAYEQACYGNCLNFEFEIDQSYLSELIDSLEIHVRI
ncbi:hypothetical protein H4J57_16250 [Colwellia sp. BRX8-7]|jgi:hypothetical protein|uniref:WapI family immunity protein n=1 Tax=Colwellia sp. BRX8-7 TaxID=2759833 RepID=UPI0015F3D1B0|nr:hypothetical protein [Colwellia sp. BRX8-7]MBA6338745.1 hypothetical protein [Colwellia sp. BRX8-7]